MTNILLTGATGYLGGSVLSTLLKSSDLKLTGLEITALVRNPDQAEKLQAIGVSTTVFTGLDDLTTVKSVASQHDIIINTANSYHPPSAKAMIEGLAERQYVSKKPTHFIHASGTSNLGDRRITDSYIETSVFSDKDDIHPYEREREAKEQYAQRTTDMVVFEEGEKAKVRTYILMSPTIYGIGTGLFNRTSIQINSLIRAAQRGGFTPVIGKGDAEWDHVHVEDLAGLYEVLLSGILRGNLLPSGKKGVYFNETGHHSWREVSERIAKAGKEAGFLASEEVKEIGLQEGERALQKPLDVVELGFASNSRTRADLAREIGWAPKRTRESFESFVLQFIC